MGSRRWRSCQLPLAGNSEAGLWRRYLADVNVA